MGALPGLEKEGQAWGVTEGTPDRQVPGDTLHPAGVHAHVRGTVQDCGCYSLAFAEESVLSSSGSTLWTRTYDHTSILLNMKRFVL